MTPDPRPPLEAQLGSALLLLRGEYLAIVADDYLREDILAAVDEALTALARVEQEPTMSNSPILMDTAPPPAARLDLEQRISELEQATRVSGAWTREPMRASPGAGEARLRELARARQAIHAADRWLKQPSDGSAAEEQAYPLIGELRDALAVLASAGLVPGEKEQP